MHELPVTQGILDVALEAAAQAGGRRITQIDLTIGALSSIVDDSVQFYFDIISRGTPAEQATLCFRRVPALLHCVACGNTHETQAPLPDHCPQCGSTNSLLLRDEGRDFSVESITVEDEETQDEEDFSRESPGCEVYSGQQ